eukprot:GFUD01039293.1.p1 GENE.GFUD01039293.1~~GFUD01039293.1.p1  ORF type:complete len:755 (+),score=230.57 GFUD01039293.1:37-2301(+)
MGTSSPPTDNNATSRPTSSLENIVPACPPGLCINKGDFLKHDFSVDNFFIEVGVREGGAGLDVLRDDLGIYLKVLRSSMIELINQDYADFVNLSTNLVGLDQGIDRIREPLEGFHQEIETVNGDIKASLESVKSKLTRQETIRRDKERLSSLQQVAATLSKVERMVGCGTELNTDMAERIATDVNQLHFAVWKMKDAALIKQILPRLNAVCDALNSWLDLTTLQGVKERDMPILSRCCRIYATIDRIGAAETLVREMVVRPRVESCVVEPENIDSSKLSQVFNSLLSIIPEHLGELIKLTTDQKKLVNGSVNGFDFLVNSFWPEVAEKIKQDLGHISSPGNPDEFFKNYQICIKFLDDFEKNLTSEESVARLRSHESYDSFLQTWNLPVYFQIRFQEIAKSYEISLANTELVRSDSDCKLQATEEAKSAISKCFSSDIFLQPLAHRFFKLSLQIISRYQVWALMCLKLFKDGPEISSDMKRSETAKDFQKLDINNKRSLKKSVSDQHLPELDKPIPVLTICLADLVLIFCDLEHLISAAPSLVTSGLTSVLPETGGLDLSQAVTAGVTGLTTVLPQLSAAITASIVTSPAKMVKSVGDIPRMYRRTNREMPSKPCTYIVSIVEELKSFMKCQETTCSLAAVTSWLGDSCDSILGLYLVQVQDVLSNVTKMEESLRKLKKVRERSGGVAGKDKAAGLSDDDKIRLQIYLDVMFLLREMGSAQLGSLERVVEGENGVKIKKVVELAVSSFIGNLSL